MKNLFISCSLLLVLAVCASCYDFQDPHYNQILAADIQELENATQYEEEDTAELHSRRRRAATVLATTAKTPQNLPDCKPVSYNPCCDVNPSELTPLEQEYRRTCYKETFLKKDDVKSNKTTTYDPFNCEKIMKIRNDILCMSQCVAQKMKLADADGNMITEGIAKVIADKYNSTWVAPISKTLAMKCAKQVKETTLNFLKNKQPGTCNPAFSEISFCLYKEMQMACPEDQIRNLKRCDSFKSFVKKANPNAL